MVVRDEEGRVESGVENGDDERRKRRGGTSGETVVV